MSLRDEQRSFAHEVEIRNSEIRANTLFLVGTVAQGGERHLIQVGDGVVTSRRFGGSVAIGQVALMRNDSGQSFFY